MVLLCADCRTVPKHDNKHTSHLRTSERSTSVYRSQKCAVGLLRASGIATEACGVVETTDALNYVIVRLEHELKLP